MRFIPELDLPESADHLFPIELFMRMKWLPRLAAKSANHLL